MSKTALGWLGRYSRSPGIRESGLWNVNHVGEDYDPEFLDLLAESGDDRNVLNCLAEAETALPLSGARSRV